jgi:hypothetical protein
LCHALSLATRNTAIVVNHNRFIAAKQPDFYHTDGYDTSLEANRTGSFLRKNEDLALDAICFSSIAVFIGAAMAAMASATHGG